jgi:phenylacetate-CoA ligase
MIYEKIAKHVLLPLYLHKSKNQTLKRLAQLEQSQYASAEILRQRQLDALKRLLHHCYQNVPFYRERFDSVGFDPELFKDFGDLTRIPYLTKQDLQQNLSQLVAGNCSKENLVIDASGGSTGKPTNFYKDTRRFLDSRADQIRHDRWCGWDLGEKCVKLWGAQREFDSQLSRKYQLVEKYVHRVYGFNAFDISEEKVLNYLIQLKTIQPSMILAYANVATLFANIIWRNNVDMSGLRLKGLICSAETLTEEKRAAIESAFRCKVLNRYGSREVGLVASECLQQDGLHVNTDSVYLEIEKQGKQAAPGEPGEIIVTDLWNYGMPFIRYQMGDVGVRSLHPCSCGRNLPTIKDVTGRVSDFFVDAKGGLVHGEYFTHLFYGLEAVEQFQLIQETRDRMTMRIVPGSGFAPSMLDPVLAKVRQCIGSEVAVDIQYSHSSLVEVSGKFRFTISKVSNSYFND